jgi:hypothetical protein
MAAEAACLQPPGDVSGNGISAVEDVQCVVLAVLWSLGGAQGNAPACIQAPGAPSQVVDHNCDGLITIADAVLGIRFALSEPLDPLIDANNNQCVDACESDLDGDGVPDSLDCAPLNPNIKPGAAESCNGWDDNCDGIIDNFSPNNPEGGCAASNLCVLNAGCVGLPAGLDLRITEVMIDPVVVGDAVGEWFELVNFGPLPINIEGWALQDDSGEFHTIKAGAAVIVPAQAAVLLGANKNPQSNGGVPILYAWSGFTLDNASDSIKLLDKAGNVRAQVT